MGVELHENSLHRVQSAPSLFSGYPTGDIKRETGEIKLGDEKRKIVSEENQSTSPLKEFFEAFVNNEAVRSVFSWLGTIAIGLATGYAIKKVREYAAKEESLNQLSYEAVGKEVVKRVAQMGKGMLPVARSLPSEVFDSVTGSIAQCQMAARMREAFAAQSMHA